jgi:hypothetical protein
MSDPSIYRPYSRLVRVRIRGLWFEVPENNILLRCFQFLAPGVPYGPFCWNGDCENDRIRYRESEKGAAKTGLACQTLVKDGMELDEISPELARVLAPAFEARSRNGDEGATAPAAGAGSGRS